MEYAWHDLAGNLGVVLVLAAYLWLQLDKIDSRGLWYSLLNGLGAALILYSLLYEFNLSAFVVELLWVLISFIGIYRWISRKVAPVGQISDK